MSKPAPPRSSMARWQSAGRTRQTLKVPLGLQLYSVRELLPKDYEGTLKQLGAIGFREVESAGYYNHSAAQVKQAMSDAGLHLVSAHYCSDDLHQKLDEILAFNKELGVSYIICSFPGFKDPSRVKNIPPKERVQRLHARRLAMECGAVQRHRRKSKRRRPEVRLSQPHHGVP